MNTLHANKPSDDNYAPRQLAPAAAPGLSAMERHWILRALLDPGQGSVTGAAVSQGIAAAAR